PAHQAWRNTTAASLPMDRKPIVTACALACITLGAGRAAAQTSASESDSAPAAEHGVPLERLIATGAKKAGKQFVVDPRVHAAVTLIGQDQSEITYPQLLTVLEVYGYIAVDDGTYVRVVPDASARSEPIATITAKDTRPASEYVTEVIPVRYA